MADYQIDELSLKIDIQGASKKNADNIRDIASAIRSLNKAVSNSGALNNLEEYSKNLQKLAGSIRSSFADIKSGTAAGGVTPKMTDVDGGRTNKEITDKLPPAKNGQNNEQVNLEQGKNLIIQLRERIAARKEEIALIREKSKLLNAQYTESEKTLKDGRKQTTQTLVYEQDGLKKTESYINGVLKSKKTLIKSQKQEGDVVKKSTGIWSKFTRAMGRIAMYRAIRAVLKSITQAMVEGVQNYAKYSDSANKAISNIKNSFQQVKDTFGITFGYILESLEPLITALSDKIVEFADNINMALAAMKGEDTYKKAIKRNEDYAKSLDKVNNKLLSFDKFESLNAEEKTDYDPVPLPDELPEGAKAAENIIGTIKDIVDVVKELWEALKPILDIALKIINKLLPPIKKIAGWIKDGIDALNEAGLLEPILWGIAAVLAVIALTNPFTAIAVAIAAVIVIIGVLKEHWQDIVKYFQEKIQAIKDWFTQLGEKIKLVFSAVVAAVKKFFVDLWHNIANGFASMINGIVNGFIKFVNILIDGLNLILKPIDAIAGLFGGNVEIPHWEAHMDWKPYAKGGVPEVGTMFYAGEAGAEIVSTSRSGQTGVANVEQISQAMLQALINYNAAQNGQAGGGNVYLDGRQVGQLVESSVYREGVRVGHFKRA